MQQLNFNFNITAAAIFFYVPHLENAGKGPPNVSPHFSCWQKRLFDCGFDWLWSGFLLMGQGILYIIINFPDRTRESCGTRSVSRPVCLDSTQLARVVAMVAVVWLARCAGEDVARTHEARSMFMTPLGIVCASQSIIYISVAPQLCY